MKTRKIHSLGLIIHHTYFLTAILLCFSETLTICNLWISLEMCSPMFQIFSFHHFSRSEQCALRTTEGAFVQLSLGKKGMKSLASHALQGSCWEKERSLAELFRGKLWNTFLLPLGHKQISTSLLDSMIRLTFPYFTLKLKQQNHSMAEYTGTQPVTFWGMKISVNITQDRLENQV